MEEVLVAHWLDRITFVCARTSSHPSAVYSALGDSSKFIDVLWSSEALLTYQDDGQSLTG